MLLIKYPQKDNCIDIRMTRMKISYRIEHIQFFKIKLFVHFMML